MKPLQKIWYSLTGRPAKFSMENRAFNAVTVVGLLILFVFGILNILIDLMAAGAVTLCAAVLLLILYYFARFRKRFHTSLAIFVVSSYVLLSAGFFFNEGIDGPVFYLIIASFLMVLMVVPKRQQPYWMITHLIVGSALISSQYWYPDLIPYTYSKRAFRFLDHGMTYVATIVFIFALMHYLRKNYNYERSLAKRRTDQLQHSNRIIREQNDELQELNHEKDKLFSIISHDLRNPLGSMKALLEVLDEETVNEAEKKELQGDLLTLANSTFVLLENLLHWSSQKVAMKNQVFQKISVSTAIEDTVHLLSPSIKAKQLQLKTCCDADAYVCGDMEMLRIIVRNLLSNAIKFTPEGGNLYISCSKESEHVTITVKDSGVGIPEAKQKELLNGRPSSTFGTQNESGSGLGLVLCREYANTMNGRIDFTSRPGEGTEFRVQLPTSANVEENQPL